MTSTIKSKTLLFIAVFLFCLSTTFVLGALPVTNTAEITPTTAYTDDTLLGVCNVTDADNDTITYAYTWYVNGTNTSSVQNLSSGNFSHYDNITFSCRGNDGTNDSDWVNSTILTISNTLPVATVSSISPATAYTNDTLVGTCTVTDLDGDSVTTYYTWYVNGVEVSLQQNLSSGNFSNFDEVELSCNGNDQEGYSTSLNSSVKTISVILSVTATEFDDPTTTNFSGVADLTNV